MQGGRDKGDWNIGFGSADGDKTSARRKDKELGEKSRRVVDRKGRGLTQSGEQGAEADGETYMEGADSVNI